MNYVERISKVIEYIGQHLDDRLDIDQLSDVACFSKYHFHRLFTAHTGQSLQQTIRWLRLKRAGHQLVVLQDRPIIEIALQAGFESHEAFTRAFKQVAGVPPSEFRKAMEWSVLEKPPYVMPQQGTEMIKVEIKNMPARRLAVIEHRGDPKKMPESVNRLVNWAKAQPVSVKPNPGDSFGIAYDDPDTVAPEAFRFDLGVTVPESLELKSPVVERKLPAGRYAVAMHKGSRTQISQTTYAMYRDWLLQSNEELGDLPCLFCYHNFDHEVAETEQLTEVWILLANKL